MRIPLTADEIVRQLHDIEYVIDWEAVRAAFGVHMSHKIGSGFRFGGIRPEYFWPRGHPKESATEIYDEPYVTVWHTTRQIPVFILADLSGSMSDGSALLKRARCARLEAAIAYSAYLVPRDPVTYIGFTDRVEPSMYFGESERDKGLPRRIADARLKFRGARKAAAGLQSALAYLPQHEPALCFVISDFWPPGTFLPHLKAAANLHDVVPIVVRDMLEEHLPQDGGGYVPLIDAESGEEVIVPLGVRTAIRDANTALKAAFAKSGIEAIWCTPDGNDLTAVNAFFLRRLAT